MPDISSEKWILVSTTVKCQCGEFGLTDSIDGMKQDKDLEHANDT
jgi:hypothetical protein